MSLNNDQFPADQSSGNGSMGKLRKPYSKPQLSALGDLRTFTLGPSLIGNTDSPLNGAYKTLGSIKPSLVNGLPALDFPTPGIPPISGNPTSQP